MKRWLILLSATLAASFAPADNATAAKGNTKNPPQQCWSVTQSGNRCKRRAAPGERYCRQHAASAVPSKPVVRCRSMTPEGIQCAEKPVEGKRYCQKHLAQEPADAVGHNVPPPKTVSPDGRGDPARRSRDR